MVLLPSQTFLRLGIPLGAPGILSRSCVGFLQVLERNGGTSGILKGSDTFGRCLSYMANITDNAGVSADRITDYTYAAASDIYEVQAENILNKALYLLE